MGDAAQMGIAKDTSLFFAPNADGQKRMWHSLGRQVSEYRSGRKQKFSFDAEDQQHPDPS